MNPPILIKFILFLPVSDDSKKKKMYREKIHREKKFEIKMLFGGSAP